MTNKDIDKAKGRAKEAAGALTGNRRLKNEGRADRAKALRRTPWTRSPTRSPAATEPTGRGAHARTNPTETREVTICSRSCSSSS
jgi:hypothetical protein